MTKAEGLGGACGNEVVSRRSVGGVVVVLEEKEEEEEEEEEEGWRLKRQETHLVSVRGTMSTS